MTNFTQQPGTTRPIRSFVRRSGRITSAQRRALDRYWPRFGTEPEGLLELDQLFGRCAPRYAEIGFGMGDALIEMARGHPQWDYLGIEVYDAGIGRLLGQLAYFDLDNVRVVRGDAAEVLATSIPDQSLDGILLFFPDPWPKRRHHKRRLVQPPFVSLVCAKLQPGGIFHLATDLEDYAWQMLAVLEREPALQNAADASRFSLRPTSRPITKFERHGLASGCSVWELMFRRVT